MTKNKTVTIVKTIQNGRIFGAYTDATKSKYRPDSYIFKIHEEEEVKIEKLEFKMKNARQDFMHPSELFLENEDIVLMNTDGNYDKFRRNETMTTKSKS